MTEQDLCSECGGFVTQRRLREHELADLGVRVVLYGGASALECQNCGESGIEIAGFPAMLYTVAAAILKRQHALLGKEIRFVRSVLRKSKAQMAEAVGMAPDYYAAFEANPTLGGASHKAHLDFRQGAWQELAAMGAVESDDGPALPSQPAHPNTDEEPIRLQYRGDDTDGDASLQWSQRQAA